MQIFEIAYFIFIVLKCRSFFDCGYFIK